MGLTSNQRSLITKIRTGGGSELGVTLDDAVCCYLLAIIIKDLGLENRPLQTLVSEAPEELPELRLRMVENKIIMEIGSEYLAIPRSSMEKIIAEQEELPEDIDESGPVP